MIKLENSVAAYKKIVLLRLFSETFLILLLQYISIISCNLNQSIMWLSSGTAIAFIFLRGYSSLIGLALGSLLGFYVQSVNGFEAFKLTSIILLQTISIYYFTQHYIYPSLVFHARSQLIKFSILTFSICLISTYLVSNIPVSQAFIANMNGIFIVGFSFTYLDAYFPGIAKLNVLQWPSVLIALFLALISGLILNFIPLTNLPIYSSFTLFLFSSLSLFFTIKQ